MRTMLLGLALVSCFIPAHPLSADAPIQRNPREALQAFNDWIGSWKATGQPEGTLQEKQRGFWTESLRWRWQFKGDDAWLKVAVDQGKYFRKGELRYLPDKDLFQLTLTTIEDEVLTFQGRLQDDVLTLERQDETKKETQRLVLRSLHGSRFLYRYEVKQQDRSSFRRIYTVGATKEGVAFAGPGNANPECVVSGGLGTIRLSYKGETYYVCCTGCRDAFQEDPEKYIKEFQAKKAKGAKDKGR